MSRRRAAFFFGSGISFASGMPSVTQITDAALNENWHLNTNQIFVPGLNQNPGLDDDVTPRVLQFLKEVRICAEDYLSELSRDGTVRAPHYEDLFSLVEQASRTDRDTIPNLAVVEFQRRLKASTEELYTGFESSVTGGEGFSGLAETTCEFLHWVVHHSLSAKIQNPQGLSLISETARAVEELDIFTLNHDRLVETQIRNDGIKNIDDGFNDLDHGEFRVFGGWKQEGREKVVRLFKLHGSLDWYLYEFPGWARQYAVPTGQDAFHSHNERGHLVRPVEWKAAFLSGTVVKEQRYGLGFWGALIHAFRERLGEHNRLICCGYGFGDVGINQRLQQWANDLPGENQLVILSPDSPEKYLTGKPPWLSELYERRQITFVPHYLEDCEIEDLKPYFEQTLS